ncbi:MAG: hypothetical protein ACLVKO_01125 [Dysgonomonas sp.]
MTKYPATYTGDTVIYQTNGVLSKYTTQYAKDLPAGDYVFSLIEGSVCHDTKTVPVTIGTYTAGPTNIFYNYYYPGQYAMYPAATDDENWTKTLLLNLNYVSAGSGVDFEYLLINSTKYFEYALYYEGDDISDPNALTWTGFDKAPSTPTSSGDRIRFPNLPYSLSEMHDDKTNRVPKVLVRPKGCTDTKFMSAYSPYYPEPYASYMSSDEGCNLVKLTFYVINDYRGLMNYPLAGYKLTDPDGIVLKESNGPIRFANATNQITTYVQSPKTGNYKIEYTDAMGKKMAYQLSVERYNSRQQNNGCKL